MSTKTPDTKLRSKARAHVRELDKQFPDSTRGFTIAPSSNPAADIASLRSRFEAGPLTDGQHFDTSNMRWMLDVNRQKAQRELEIASGNRFHRNIASDREELASLMRGAERSRELAEELAQYRQFEITSDLLAMPFALGAFQSVNLSADELPQIITPMARQYFTVRYLGQDGGAREAQWRNTRSAAEIEMRMLGTDKVEYPIIDLQQGDVNEFSKINAQLRYDLEMKVDDLALTNMNSGIMTSGIKSLLNIHPLINQANLPDSNYLDLTDVPTYGAAHVFTVARLKALLSQMAKWGFGFDPAGPVNIQSMVMSPLHARDSWDYVDLVSGWNSTATAGFEGQTRPKDTVSTQQRDAIMSSGGMMQSAWGYNWDTQYNSRLASGRVYVMTNQPVGWFFTKSEYDRVIEWKDQPDNIERNLAQIMMRRAVQFYMPQLWAYRYLVVDF